MTGRSLPDSAGTVLVAVCTFRRPALAATLHSLAHLAPCGHPVRIAVADNDLTPSAEALVARIAADHPLPITYLHAPAANISIARNALLDHAEATGARFLASLDDDEEVEPQWLSALLAAWRAEQAGAGPGRVSAVLGPVRAAYGPGAPAWMAQARAHDILPVVKGGRIASGYTSNALLDLAHPALQGLRYDPARGRTGGEDSAFFDAILARGGQIAFAETAIAHEVVPAERARLRWLLRRRYRMGQTHASLITEGRGRGSRAAAAALAATKAAACLGLAAVGAARADWRNRQVMRAALHIGAVAHLIGARPLEIYGTAAGGSAATPPAQVEDR